VTDADDSGDADVTLDGTGSSDPDGAICSYDWSEGGTPLATGSTPTASLAVGVHTHHHACGHRRWRDCQRPGHGHHHGQLAASV